MAPSLRFSFPAKTDFPMRCRFSLASTTALRFMTRLATGRVRRRANQETVASLERMALARS